MKGSTKRFALGARYKKTARSRTEEQMTSDWWKKTEVKPGLI